MGAVVGAAEGVLVLGLAEVGCSVGSPVGGSVGRRQLVGSVILSALTQPELPPTGSQTLGIDSENPAHVGHTWHAKSPVFGSEHPFGGGSFSCLSTHPANESLS